jgi:hypothetical protein
MLMRFQNPPISAGCRAKSRIRQIKPSLHLLDMDRPDQPKKVPVLGQALKYYGAGSAFATFTITRSGIASPPAEIPQEAGTTWDVILESSSDLVNWTAANPGVYSGTEPKRFFRTRMVKKP